MAQRKFCTNCKYPMLPLARFDGTSSLDAPRPTARGEHGNWVVWLLLTAMWPLMFLWFLVSNLWMGQKRKKRRQKIAELKRSALAIDREAQVCPLCLHVEWSFVKL